jgi:alpha-L-fucosidase
MAFYNTFCTFLAVASLGEAVIFKPQNAYQALSGVNTSFPVDLQPFYNNRAFGLYPNDASFDGEGSR